MRSRTSSSLLILCLSICLSSVTFADSPNTYILHLNGIGGERIMDRWLTRGLAKGGLNADWRIYDWTGPDAGMVALGDVKLHQQQSRIVAQMITDYRRAHPDQRFILTSHSAGCGIAAWALAQLPPDVNIDTWLMLEPALSPKFDLSASLAHVTGKAYAFSSRNDVIVLSIGTQLMGTVDRVKTDAAGFVGFKRPDTGDVAEYMKLVNIHYDDTWLRFGNVGDHIGCMFPPFVHNVLAPLMIDGKLPTFPPLLPATQPTNVQAKTE